MSQLIRNVPSQFPPYSVAIYLLAFSIPVLKYGIQIPIAILILAWVFSKKELKPKNLIPILLFSSVYVFHIIGMLYTENFDRGWQDLIQKLSLILFPVIVGTGPKLTEHNRNTAINFFISGVLVAVFIGFLTSTFEYLASNNPQAFYMSDFSPFHHPSYLSFYMVMAIAMLLIKSQSEKKTASEFVLWILILFMSLSLIFPASKMGFLNLAMVFFLFLLKWIFGKPRFNRGVFYLVGIGLLFLIFLKNDPVASYRVERAVAVTSKADQPKKEEQMESSTARIYAWNTALDIIKETPFGVGTGDANDAMVTSFREQNLNELADKNLNPHNEFLQLGVAIGLPGLLLFIFSLIFPFRKIYSTRDWLYGLFLLSVFAQFSVESMLEKQSGVIFFAFFNAFLFFSPKSSKWS